MYLFAMTAMTNLRMWFLVQKTSLDRTTHGRHVISLVYVCRCVFVRLSVRICPLHASCDDVVLEEIDSTFFYEPIAGIHFYPTNEECKVNFITISYLLCI